MFYSFVQRLNTKWLSLSSVPINKNSTRKQGLLFHLNSPPKAGSTIGSKEVHLVLSYYIYHERKIQLYKFLQRFRKTGCEVSKEKLNTTPQLFLCCFTNNYQYYTTGITFHILTSFTIILYIKNIYINNKTCFNFFTGRKQKNVLSEWGGFARQ